MTSVEPAGDALAAWPVVMAPTDAMFFKGEVDLRTRGTGNLIYTLDSIPDWDRFVAVWDRASRILPPLHKRVVKPSMPGRLPEWHDDPNFDLLFHVRRVAVPAPGTLRQVFDYAEADGMALHDPGRPLWQVTLMEGLNGDGAAVLMKFHHSWMDGNANVQLGRLLYETERDGDLDKPMPDLPSGWGSRARFSPFGPAVRGSLAAARQAWSLTSGVGRVARRTISHPRTALAEGSELAASARRVLTPVAAKPSPLLSGRSPRSRYDTLDFPFQDLRKATKSIGCTVNDGYLAGVAGGLRRYHEHFGVHVEKMPIGMPISTRSDTDPALGNQVSATMLAAPIALADPAERMLRFHELVLGVRHEPVMDVLAGSVNLMVHLPDQLMHGPLAQLVKIDVGVSQVVGLREPHYLAGAQLMGAYGFGPHASIAVFIGMMTHLDTCCVGVHSDPAAVTDPELFVQCLREGFDEVIAVGARSAPARLSTRSGTRG
jgi:diacylglycerol O-acyltransferase / wax synthase